MLLMDKHLDDYLVIKVRQMADGMAMLMVLKKVISMEIRKVLYLEIQLVFLMDLYLVHHLGMLRASLMEICLVPY